MQLKPRKKICDVYGSSAASVRVAQIWFKRFQFGNYDVKDAPRSGRPITDKWVPFLKKWSKIGISVITTQLKNWKLTTKQF
ncbi:jg21400 [Pararge aegeria aegeria]|uniref:Jg21400 protein n=1 Tax=Pararge aegeria aegeria TaxID=348720 RepID=A0A8S4S162_9NEOP|nr:jg21400 [Pararge aegeria aegeria]